MSSIENLYNQKWQKFLKRIWLFRFIPFVDFVLAAGSLATGNVKENSDFDVIVGCRQGRIFTARFCCVLLFSLFGWRAVHRQLQKQSNFQYFTLLKEGNLSRNKICFNHFVTPNAYRLSPPHNEYWKNLYKSLVPVYGADVEIQKFFDANKDWNNNVVPRQARELNLVPERSAYWRKVEGLPLRKSGLTKIKEWAWSGYPGDLMERFFKRIQIRRIEKSLKITKTYNPRIIYNDNELEFHPDTKRIDGYLQNL